QEDRERDRDRRKAEQDDDPAPVEEGDERRAGERDDDGPDVAAADVRADREAAPRLGELLGEQRVPDRMLRRATDPGHDVDDRERCEVRSDGLGGEAATEQQATGGEEL